MGKKTDKKIKSDRINVLRKQYDSFLEEDKKRRERNEYILGRLEKMRYSSMAVQLHTPTAYQDFPVHNRHSYEPEKLEPTVERMNMQMVHVNQQINRPGYQSLQLEVPRTFTEEASLLREISKKYILIPKLRSTYSNIGFEAAPLPAAEPVSSVKPDKIDNDDWKSKYDILKQIKNDKKEVELKYAHNEPCSSLGNSNVNDPVLQSDKREDSLTTYEIPEKDVPGPVEIENDLKSLAKCIISEKNNNNNPIPCFDHPNVLCLQVVSLKTKNSTPYYDEDQSKNHDLYQNVNEVSYNEHHNTEPEQYAYSQNNVSYQDVNEVSEPKRYTSPLEQNIEPVSYNNNNTVEFKAADQEYPIEYDQFIPESEPNANYTEQIQNQEGEPFSPSEVKQANELVDQNIGEHVEQTAFEVNNAVIPNSQDFTLSEAVSQNKQGSDLQTYITDDDITAANPVSETTPEVTANTDIAAGIEEFDAEQREMFYSKQPDENYAYEQGDGYNADGQNEAYPQSQDYAYYEGVGQEAYPVEVNEYEETQQQYDPNYEQQYNANYDQAFEGQHAGYEEQQAGYEEQPTAYVEQDPSQMQFEQPAVYDTTQEGYEQYYEQQPEETVTHVEQVLDTEEGYMEKNVEPVNEQNQAVDLLNSSPN